MTAYSFSQLIDFTRTSSGTFVGSNGLIQTTPQSRNLLLWTQDFDNAYWVKSDATITANSTTAPDGTATADKLVEGATTNRKFIRQAATNGMVSVYAKKGERDFVTIGSSNGVGLWAVSQFNLNTGTYVGSYQAGTQPLPTNNVITPVGNGWYRVSCLTASSLLPAVVMVSNGGDPIFEGYTGNGTSGIFIWGAQLDASVLTDYTRNVGGLFPARFDYDPVTLAPRGILIEEQRTNLLTYSAQFDDAAWLKLSGGTGVTPVVTANAGVAPDGTNTADRVVLNRGAGTTSSDISRLFQNTGTLATVGMLSVWMRSFDGVSSYSVRLLNSFGELNVTVTPTWQRFSVVSTSTSTNAQIAVRGDQNQQTADILVWGAQLEAGAFATSYIPTVASQVTRTADQASIVAPMFAPWYNESAGTFVMEGTAPNVFGPGFIGAGAGTGVVYRAVNNAEWWNGSAVVATANSVANWGTPIKLAAAYDSGGRAFCLAGGAVATTATTLPNGGKLELGRAYNGAVNFLNGHLRNVRFYPVRLSDLQLQALTQ